MFDFPQFRWKRKARDHRHKSQPEVASCLGTKFDNGEVRFLWGIEGLRQANIEMFLKNLGFEEWKRFKAFRWDFLNLANVRRKLSQGPCLPKLFSQQTPYNIFIPTERWSTCTIWRIWGNWNRLIFRLSAQSKQSATCASPTIQRESRCCRRNLTHSSRFTQSTRTTRWWLGVLRTRITQVNRFLLNA